MNPNPHGGSRHFECASCHMTITFPPNHEMVDKMQGTYWIQSEWFCCAQCVNMKFDHQESVQLS